MNTGSFSHRDVARRVTKPPDPCLMRALTAVIPAGSSVLDLGAGTGRYVRALREAGYRAYGVDGGEDVERLSDGLVQHADLTDDSCAWHPARDPNWAICIEVGEHVPESLLSRFLNSVCSVCADGFVCSWARPGQRGRNHISCRSPEWVAAEFARRDWILDESATAIARNASLPSGFSRKLLVFHRNS